MRREGYEAWTPQAENFVEERSPEQPYLDADPWPDANLDPHGENEGGTMGYPRRLTDENFDPGQANGYFGSVARSHVLGDRGRGPVRLAAGEMDELAGLYQRQLNDFREKGVSGSGQPGELPCAKCGKPAKFDKIYASYPEGYANYKCEEGHESHYRPRPREGRKTARKDLSPSERFALIEERGEASNSGKLALEGTHYIDMDPDLGLALSLGLGL